MIIRNLIENGERRENAFVAVDNLENPMGSCKVEPHMNDQLMPDRPLEIRVSAEGKPEAQQQLWAAAMARAMAIARESGLKARVYAECRPDDEALLNRLLGLGFSDDDRLVRMRRRVERGGATVPMPEGCVLIADRLDDPDERRFFLEREEKLFHRANAEAWLRERAGYPLFRRLLLTSRQGLAGEALVWGDRVSRTGVVGQIYTVPQWRRRGVASFLLEAARLYFDGHPLPEELAALSRFAPDRPLQDHLPEAIADVRWRMNVAKRLFSGAGYRRGETFLLLPGIDL